MKITKEFLKRMINEELNRVLKENNKNYYKNVYNQEGGSIKVGMQALINAIHQSGADKELSMQILMDPRTKGKFYDLVLLTPAGDGSYDLSTVERPDDVIAQIDSMVVDSL